MRQLQLLEVKICHFCGREAPEPDDRIIRTNASARDMPLVSLKFRSGGNDKQVIYFDIALYTVVVQNQLFMYEVGGRR